MGRKHRPNWLYSDMNPDYEKNKLKKIRKHNKVNIREYTRKKNIKTSNEKFITVKDKNKRYYILK